MVLGSICDTFGTSLGRIADIVKPPIGLVLPTQPAASEVTILRIAAPNGDTRKTCSRPAPPPATPIAPPDPLDPCDPTDPANVAAQAYIDTVKGTYDWWFTATTDQICSYQKLPTSSSRYVFINHDTLNCEANPGETYSLDYLGQLPPGGCVLDSDCSDAMGGAETEWTCFAGLTSDAAPLCVSPTAAEPGTCICGSAAVNCANGYTP